MTQSVPEVQNANPYLAGHLAPVATEVSAMDLRVTGHIPEHLHGRYLRNGSNPAAEVDPGLYHWFIGEAMVHGLALHDGKALWYRNRWVRTPEVCDMLGEPRTRRVDRSAGLRGISPSTNVIAHGGRTLALVEGGMASYELTEDIDTVGTCDFDGTLRGGFTAHPHRDPATGELHALSYSIERGRFVEYSVIDNSGRARHCADIPVPGLPMIHDFSLTEKYIVIYDLPVTFDSDKMATHNVLPAVAWPARIAMRALAGRVRVPNPVMAQVHRATKPFDTLPFSWDPKHPSRVGVMPRDGTGADVRWFDVEPCYVFHPLNGYSEDRDGSEVLVLDVVRYDRVFDRDHRGPSDSPPTLDRWEINLTTGAVRTERRHDRQQEFPRINETLTGARHRYGYTMGLDGAGSFASADDMRTSVFKHDYLKGSTETAPLVDELWVGEMSFVPNPGATAEDDGVLMGFAYHRSLDEGQLLILDAATLDTMATVHLPQRVPMGFHGSWAPAG